MPTTIRGNNILYNDSTTQTSASGVAKAWVRFFGFDASTINAFNVSSVSRTGTGQYLITLTNALADGNCMISTGVSSGFNPGEFDNIQGSARFYNSTSTTVTVATILGNGTAFSDAGQVTVTFFR